MKKKIKVSPPTDVRRMSLLELPIKRRKKRRCCAKIKKKENVRSAPCPNAVMAMFWKDIRNFASAVK